MRAVSNELPSFSSHVTHFYVRDANCPYTYYLASRLRVMIVLIEELFSEIMFRERADQPN